MQFRIICALLFSLSVSTYFSQHIYYKHLNPEIVNAFSDSTQRLICTPEDSSRFHQFSYVLNFYPGLQCKNISIAYRFSKHTVLTKPKPFSLFKAPSQRMYTVWFSKTTASVMDSVSIFNLSYDAQIGIIANQMSLIEDLSTGGFFNFLQYYIRGFSAKGRNKVYQEAEERTLELGLGYQMLTYNLEFANKLQIQNWQSDQGYDTYIKYYRNRSMKSELVKNLLIDLPVYIQHDYK